MVALSGLSSDDVAEILTYLDAVTIMRMTQCGSGQLNTKISQSCKNLELESFPFMKFPFALFNFPNVTSIAIHPHKQATLYPLRLNGALPLPSTPAKALEKFHLTCTQSFSVLTLQNGIPRLATAFPNLKDLKLVMSFVLLTDDHMEALPRGLESLHLTSRISDASSSPLSILSLINLPPTLRSVYLESVPISVDAETNDYSTVVWPPHLTNLTLRSVDACILSHLPPTVEFMDLYFVSDRGNRFSSPIPTEIFPTSLISLSIADRTRGKLKFAPTTFPPNLTSCDLPFDYSLPYESGWSHLPKSLTECSFSSDFKKSTKVIAHLPNLATLPGSFVFFMNVPNTFLPSLPPKLVSLRMYTIPLSSIPFLPPTIQDLMVKISPLSIDAENPQLSSKRGDMTRLPPNLTSLSLINGSKRRFHKADFDYLPASLRELYFDLRDINHKNTLLAIPRSLKALTMTISGGQETLLSDPSLFEALPTGLGTLEITIKTIGTVWQKWMATTQRFHAMEQLEISFDDADFDTEPIPLSFLPSIPRTITQLRLPLNHTTLTPELISSLPKNLSSLYLESSNIPDSAIITTDEALANLPKTLVFLSMPHNIQGITNKFISVIPTSLIKMSLPAHLEAHLGAFYAREADWNGFTPHVRSGFFTAH